jgi:hypothetical protein
MGVIPFAEMIDVYQSSVCARRYLLEFRHLNPYYSIGCSFCEFASGKYSVSMRNLSYFSW